MKDDFLWVEKYRPQTIEDCILPEETKNTFQSFVNTGEIPNLLLCGTAGIGKTTVAKALCNELNVDYYVINGSDEGRFLDTVRNNAKQFASTVSLTSSAKHKVIIIDEADNTTHDVQLLLRASIEEFAGNCRFIFTCNYKNKIIAPLHSRCSVVDFSIGKADKQKIAANFFNRIRSILEGEGVTFDPKVLAEVVQKYFPDFRRTLNELQRYSVSGTIDTGLLANIAEVRMESLMDALKNKEFSVARKWVNSNLDNDPNVVLRSIYENLYHVLEPVFIPQAVLIIAKYQYQSAFVADQEINLLAALTEIMVECKFK
jgi:replication factor C small subunit